jgi:hypothetical protein
VKTIFKTYRFAAFLTLLLFVGNLLVPAGTAAMSLHCEMETPTHSMHDCCDSEMDHKKVDTDDCELMSFCEQDIKSAQSDIPAVVQLSKSTVAVDLSVEIDILPNQPTHTKVFKDEAADSETTPPLFLLNSVFLN